ncbi:ABC transporter ATP-binding protein [Saccharibacillus sp. CPCC 101409]|uniref:ABC transporter ATP-binding protein n=1 Tax=Saccharibacillus sp. CPCC 101409 TaxID=3058041 RepID=UPI0026720F23|nr:ABC transporter ATP-binding protein [Saccharibacillus sp. CPCC 101409]MDO3410274.1 ABC transporter ATP-binding protein [Saccharibacillus sp. CPCC 101409]
MTVVRIDNLTKKYANRRGVEKLSLEIEAGQVLGLLGPNGSGKTTAMKAIVGLLSRDAGEVSLFGLDPAEHLPAILARTGCMIESPGLYPYLTAEQNLRLTGRFYPGFDTDAVGALLDEVGLLPQRREKVRRFSMGMKQRLALAAALLPKPDLLVLDEPTNGMDIEGAALFREIVRRETARGCAVLLSSHLSHEMEQLCTHVAVLQGGVLLDTASVPEALERYGSLERYYLKLNNSEGRGTA